MNSPLEQDFDGFDFPAKNTVISTEEADSELPILGEQINITKSLECATVELPQCEVCSQQFLSKKELRSHITLHLGQPRIILKRCTNLHSAKKKDRNTYCLSQEKKGSLKLTLKKQNHCNFEVINRDLDNNIEEEVAGGKESDEHTVEKENEEQDEVQQFENVIDDDNDKYQDDQYNSNEEGNCFDDCDRPSVEINEGDSGVGSDMANHLEKDDQNVDDLHSGDNYQQEEEISNVIEGENPEESDALEATCRETIENLKKLREHSSSIREDMSPRSENRSPADSPTDIDSQLVEDNALQILAKNSAIEIRPPDRSKLHKNNESQSNTSIDWHQLSEELANKNDNSMDKDNENSKDMPENNSDTNILLQNLLSDHEREKDDHGDISPSHSSSVETEYVSLERLAETVNKCRVCNEKFPDITLLDEHKSKAGHYQCNVPDCCALVFSTQMEVAVHKSQAHGSPLSPSLSITPTQVTQSSPRLRDHSPSTVHNHSPHMRNHSPHSINLEQVNALQNSQNSPLHHQTHSPSYSPQQMIPPVNFDQLPAPVQQLAQQVQRMALPQPQMPPSLPPGANPLIHGPNYFVSPQGRAMYRMAGPQGMQYPPHLPPHMYSAPPQYPHCPSYPQYPPPPPPQMHPSQMSQQVQQQMPPRGRYPTAILANVRATRAPPQPVPQPPSVQRQRMKRPLQSTQLPQRADLNNVAKQRRMDLLLPDRNEDADCHVIAQQKRNDGVPVIQNVQGATGQQSNRNDSTIHLTDSITLSVRQPGSAPAQVQNTGGTSTKKPDAKAVANVLAARGITVTPTANKNKPPEQQQQQQHKQQQNTTPQQQQQQQRNSGRTSPPVNVTALNLNSAISIIPASSQRKQTHDQQFAVPQNKQNKPSQPDVERPPRPPTVDLTQDTPSPVLTPARRGRPPRASLMCQFCDKSFQNQEILVQHMATHRTSNKLLHKCNLCAAQYPSAQDLQLHKQNYHKEDTIPSNGGTELAIPVVDLKSPQTLSRLTSLGIQSYIPLSQLSAQTNGYFGLPIITIDSPRNPSSYNLAALGATSILSLGPLKYLSNR